MAKTYPVRGTVYTLKEINNVLYLSDNPFLNFVYPTVEGVDEEVVIQGHISDYEAPDEAFWGLRFKYNLTTSEGIPLFYYEGDVNDLVKCLNLRLDLDPYNDGREDLQLYVTWKGADEGYKPYYTLKGDKFEDVGNVKPEALEFNKATRKRLDAFLAA